MTEARPTSGRRRPASPLARRLARIASLDLDAISGSGPAGRVVKRDVETAVASRAARGEASAPAGPAARSDASPGARPVDRVAAELAARVALTQRTIPHVRLAADCRIDALLEARRRDNGSPISLTALLVKALAIALADVPAANVSWSGTGVQHHARGDVAVSIAVEGGYVLGVVKEADTLTAGEVAGALAALTRRAREERLPAEIDAGGASVIHNLGMHGVTLMDPILEPPRGTALAIGAAEPRAVAIDGRLAVATVIRCTLAADLRALDGKVAAELLARVKALIEAPGPWMA